jgi:hypothetical protein
LLFVQLVELLQKTCKGTTIYSIFCINYTKGTPFEKLANEPVSKGILLKASKLDYLIIDEISFISCELLSYINRRLQLLKNTTKPFGGVSVLCFGDIYQHECVIPHFLFGSGDKLPPFARELFQMVRFFNLAEDCRQN